jgi:C1A family cysteine protease
MSLPSPKVGVQLSQTDLIDPASRRTDRLRPDHIPRLSALSITTVEELVSMAQEAPKFMKDFLEVTDMDQLLNRASSIATMPMSAAEIQELREITYGFGAVAPTIEFAEEKSDVYYDVFQQPSGVPPQVDLRPCFGPIRNQGERGTCVAHAVTAMREYLYNRSRGDSGTHTDLSEQFLYWICKMNDGIPTIDGTFQRIAIPLITQFGECSELTWSYNPSIISGNIGQGPPTPNAMQDASIYRIREGRCYSPRSVADIQQRLTEGYPVAISVPVYPIGQSSTFELPIVKRTGNIIMPIPGTVSKNGHAVCLVAYAFDSMFAGGGYFVIRNSWGTSWGSASPFGAGYGTIPFNYITHYCWEAYSLQP